MKLLNLAPNMIFGTPLLAAYFFLYDTKNGRCVCLAACVLCVEFAIYCYFDSFYAKVDGSASAGTHYMFLRYNSLGANSFSSTRNLRLLLDSISSSSIGSAAFLVFWGLDKFLRDGLPHLRERDKQQELATIANRFAILPTEVVTSN